MVDEDVVAGVFAGADHIVGVVGPAVIEGPLTFGRCNLADDFAGRHVDYIRLG